MKKLAFVLIILLLLSLIGCSKKDATQDENKVVVEESDQGRDFTSQSPDGGGIVFSEVVKPELGWGVPSDDPKSDIEGPDSEADN